PDGSETSPRAWSDVQVEERADSFLGEIWVRHSRLLRPLTTRLVPCRFRWCRATHPRLGHPAGISQSGVPANLPGAQTLVQQLHDPLHPHWGSKYLRMATLGRGADSILASIVEGLTV